jgi:hypothetical protein
MYISSNHNSVLILNHFVGYMAVCMLEARNEDEGFLTWNLNSLCLLVSKQIEELKEIGWSDLCYSQYVSIKANVMMKCCMTLQS